MRRAVLILATMLALAGGSFTPPARAFDPAYTPLVLGPFAVKAVRTATPYIIRGFTTGLAGLGKIGIDVLNVLKLPLGALGCTLGAPFGLFGRSVDLLVDGAIAPFQLAFHALMLPVMFSGIEVP